MTTTTRSGIPTEYRNGVFRSRIEARWAAFFDLVGWRWVYEPLDTGSYIPDFLIQGPRPFFVEVGQLIAHGDYIDKAAKPDAAVAELGHDLLVVGVSPLAAIRPEGLSGPIAGWFGEYVPGHPPADCPDLWLEPLKIACDHGPIYGWGPGLWARGAHGVLHAVMDYGCRPGGDCREDVADEQITFAIEDLWAKAGTTSQWRP